MGALTMKNIVILYLFTVLRCTFQYIVLLSRVLILLWHLTAPNEWNPQVKCVKWAVNAVKLILYVPQPPQWGLSFFIVHYFRTDYIHMWSLGLLPPFHLVIIIFDLPSAKSKIKLCSLCNIIILILVLIRR